MKIIITLIALLISTNLHAFKLEEMQDNIEQSIAQSIDKEQVSINRVKYIAKENNGNKYITSSALKNHINGDLSLTQLDVNEKRKKFTLELTDSQQQIISISGSYSNMIELPVFSQNMSRGNIIEEDDIIWQFFSEKKVRRNSVNDIENLLGKSLKRNIRSGKMIYSRDIIKPKVVSRGDLVQVVYRSANMDLRTAGTAMKNAADGDVIEIKNSKTGIILQAMISGNGEAVVNYMDVM